MDPIEKARRNRNQWIRYRKLEKIEINGLDKES